MNAYQAAFDFDPWLREQHEFGSPPPGLDQNELDRRRGAGFRVEHLLKQLGWKMVELSFETSRRFGQDSPYFIPSTFQYKQKAGITPHICQVIALSQITGYPFADWMNICGFDLSLILQLQLRVVNERTIMLVHGYDFATRPNHGTKDRDVSRYCYAKIGSGDAVLYPDVRPGSIVRADRCYSPAELKADSSVKNIWLVEHPTGITCCGIKSLGNGEVVLLPRCLPLSGWPLRVPAEARILGLIDNHLSPLEASEFRPLTRMPEVKLLTPSSNVREKLTLSRFLRNARCRTGLTFREAHKNTLRIAEIMNDRDFAISTGLLSDYEAMNKLPRHIAKIISLCTTYGIELSEVLHAAGVHLQTARKQGVVTSERRVRKGVGAVTNSVDTLGNNWPKKQRVA